MAPLSATALIDKKGLCLLGALTLAGSLAAVVFRDGSLTLANAVIGILTVWCGLIPGVIFLTQPQSRRPPFPFAALVGVYYAVFFGAATFLTGLLRDPATGKLDEYGSILIAEFSAQTQMLTLAGVCLMLGTWYLASRFLFPALPRFRIRSATEPCRLYLMAWLLALSSIAYYASPFIQSLPSVGQFLKPAGIVAFAIFAYFFTHKQLPKAHAALYFLVAFPVWMAQLLGTGSSTVIVLLGLLALAAYVQARNRIPWLPICILPLVIMLLYPVLITYRHYIWITDPGAGFVEKILYLDDAVLATLDKPPEIQKTRLSGVARRVSTQVILNRVAAMSPDPVPFMNGDTYKPLLSSWVPRLLWPDKPLENAGEAFGHRYKWIQPQLKGQSMNIAWIVEMFVNFGKTGVLVGMVLMGVFLGFLDRFFNRPDMNLLEVSVGSAILLPLTFPDSNFSLMTGSLLPLSVCLWVYFTAGFRIPLPGFKKPENADPGL